MESVTWTPTNRRKSLFLQKINNMNPVINITHYEGNLDFTAEISLIDFIDLARSAYPKTDAGENEYRVLHDMKILELHNGLVEFGLKRSETEIWIDELDDNKLQELFNYDSNRDALSWNQSGLSAAGEITSRIFSVILDIVLKHDVMALETILENHTEEEIEFTNHDTGGAITSAIAVIGEYEVTDAEGLRFL